MLPAVGLSTLPSKMAGFGTPRRAAHRLDYINDVTRWKGEMTAPGPHTTPRNVRARSAIRGKAEISCSL